MARLFSFSTGLVVGTVLVMGSGNVSRPLAHGGGLGEGSCRALAASLGRTHPDLQKGTLARLPTLDARMKELRMAMARREAASADLVQEVARLESNRALYWMLCM